MKYPSLKRELELLNRKYGHQLHDFTVSANRINNVSFLYFKDKKGVIRECIVLEEKNKRCVDVGDDSSS